MPPLSCLRILALSASLAGPAWAADDAPLQRLATCQDSWLDWQKQEPARLQRFAADIERRFTPVVQSPAFTPKTAGLQVLGLAVTQVFPQSVGMGVGFSLLVKAGLAETKQALEQQLGHPMKCESSEGSVACEVKLGDRKTALLINDDNGRAATSLLGCYYFYAP